MSTRGTGQGGTLQRTLEVFQVLGDVGLLWPPVLMGLGKAMGKWGSTVAGGVAASAARRPNDVGLVDEVGAPLTFGEIDRRSNSIARGLMAAGVRCGDGVGLFARNHRGFVEAMIALNKIGANTMLLNTGFAAPQLSEVLEREQSQIVLYDEEFEPIVSAGAGNRKRFVTLAEGTSPYPTLEELTRTHDSSELPAPAKHGRTTILTSGTTGTPKGAQRPPRRTSLDTLVGLLGRMPLRMEEKSFIAAPTFHSWGGAHLMLSSILSCTVILRRRFDPEDTLRTIHEHRPDVLAVVPVMLQRILALPPEVIRKYNTRSLRVVAASGSALPGELALRWMDTFGDNLYNFYGSTEVAQATIAMPDELRSAPGTAGRAPRGTIVKLFDAEGREVVGPNKTGRIFVGNDNQFEGYTGGGNKEVIQGLMSSGDVGRFDENGLLFVEGRDDDMIISGGENVFPREVEDLLCDHPAVHEAAVLGVPDQEFGQRLKAFVVLRNGNNVSAEDLKQYVRDHLARYKIPREIVFLPELPRNPTGKVLKRVLREQA
ncbi:MAG TPA: AMP-binding protein [Candidatus Limnocylindrales bacterium]|nr:AMP-binding protein [Candidatus Limnocylindrales bacterium]